MNNLHQNARLTLHSRVETVSRVSADRRAAEVAAAFAVALRTVRKRRCQIAQAPPPPRRGAAGGGNGRLDRASWPGPADNGALIATKLGLARSTVARWIRRAGLGCLGRIDPPAPVRCHQHERSGAATGAQAGASFLPRSMTRPGWPMSRCWATSASTPPPACCCGPCAGVAIRASWPNGR